MWLIDPVVAFYSNSWVSRGLERVRVLASGRVCGRARGKRSFSKPLLTQELYHSSAIQPSSEDSNSLRMRDGVADVNSQIRLAQCQ